jgi:hypothetical protein
LAFLTFEFKTWKKKLELMVRPRASDDNLRLAVAFAQSMIIEFDSYGIMTEPAPVFCYGGRSSFAAFAEFFPELARDALDKCPMNRHGVTVVELNKALKSVGFMPMRMQDRSSDPSKPCARVKVPKYSFRIMLKTFKISNDIDLVWL